MTRPPTGLLHLALIPEERQIIQRYPRVGAQLTQHLWPDCPTASLHVITHHHECEDGHGYPDGLRVLPPSPP